MAKASPEVCRAIAGMVRMYLKTSREMVSLRIVLATYAQSGHCPPDWENQFQFVLASDDLKSFGSELESSVALLENTADEIDLNEILAKMPPDTPIN